MLWGSWCCCNGLVVGLVCTGIILYIVTWVHELTLDRTVAGQTLEKQPEKE